MASGIRRGRPFGGTAILVNKRLNKYCHKICTYNAAVCTVECQMKGYRLILGSVYMPCDDGSQQHADDYEAAVGVLQCLLDRHIGSCFSISRRRQSSRVETQLIFELLSVIGEQKSRGARGQKDPVD